MELQYSADASRRTKVRTVLLLNRLRDLDLIAATPGRAAHASAASGLVQIGDYLHVILDDEAHLASFRLGDPAPGRTWPMLVDALPSGASDRKAVKPDFEVLLALSPSGRYGQAGLLALGSGSTARRERAVGLKLGADGDIVSASAPIDVAVLYRAMRHAAGEINLEAGGVKGDQMLLISRAHRLRPANHLFRFSAADLLQWLDEPSRPLPSFSLDVLVLPTLGNVVAGITDAAALSGGAWLISAVAEETDDSYHDGACAGAALAVLSSAGELQSWWPLAEPIKVEGICLHGTNRDLLLVNDPDDAAIPAGLYSARLPFS